MREDEVEIANVERQLDLGCELIARQVEIIKRLTSLGLSSGDAERLLDQLESTQKRHEAHLARLRKPASGV